MNVRRLAVVYVVVLVALYGLSVVLARDPREPNWEILPADMVRSPAASSMERHGGFADGIVQQTPPAGVVPRDATLFPFGPDESEMQRAGAEWTNPLSPEDGAAVARGAAIFANQCAHFHGQGGQGDGPVTQRGFPPPPSFARPESRALRDGEMFHVITHGRKNMPPAAAQVLPEDRWRVILYVRTLQGTP